VKQQLDFSFQETAQITASHLKQIAKEKKIDIHCEHIEKAFISKYQTRFASLWLPFDQDLKNKVNRLVQEKLQLKPTILVVIGIGGSALGAKAVHQDFTMQVIQYYVFIFCKQ